MHFNTAIHVTPAPRKTFCDCPPDQFTFLLGLADAQLVLIGNNVVAGPLQAAIADEIISRVALHRTTPALSPASGQLLRDIMARLPDDHLAAISTGIYTGEIRAIATNELTSRMGCAEPTPAEREQMETDDELEQSRRSLASIRESDPERWDTSWM